jgi:hypothetical protein
MHLAALTRKNSKFGAVDSLITSNSALSFVEEKEKEREGRRRKFQGS